jgi:hypothetical protein
MIKVMDAVGDIYTFDPKTGEGIDAVTAGAIPWLGVWMQGGKRAA